MKTDKNAKTGTQLAWTSKAVWGAVGNTHYATAVLDDGDTWTYTVDQPQSGHWVARGWRNGDFRLYREDRTMKGARAKVQDHFNQAQTSSTYDFGSDHLYSDRCEDACCGGAS